MSSIGSSARGAWAGVVYLPIGLQYTALAVALIGLTQRCVREGSFGAMRGFAGLRWLLGFVGWLWLSTMWSPAEASERWSHIGLYGLVLVVPFLAAALRPDEADRALAGIAAVSALVGALFVVAHLGVLPLSLAWHSTIEASGNQRIATSLLLALGSCIAAWRAVAAGVSRRSRAAWLAAAACALLGLMLQDRRSGMVVLPFLLLAWALVRIESPSRRALAVLGVAAVCAAGWFASESVRSRFHEGFDELQRPADDDEVATSWGQRRRMAEITAGLVAERPFFGRGLSSWRLSWRAHTPPGSALAAHSTPHSEVLLLAHEAGLPAAALFVALVVSQLRAARAAGDDGVPLLLAWTTIGTAATFNAVLRDAKFALPLLLIAALGAARARRGTAPLVNQ